MNEISIITNIPTLVLFSIMLLVIGAFLFLIGYFVGQRASVGVFNNEVNKSNTYNRQDNLKKEKIVIDDSKFVTEIKTQDFEKKYSDLGDKKISEENITSSINKLKNMKG